MIEQELREIASHINELRRQERMFIEELRVLRDLAGPDLSQRLAAVNARMDASNVTHVRRSWAGATCVPPLPPQPLVLTPWPSACAAHGPSPSDYLPLHNAS
jgi:hypothetical protein